MESSECKRCAGQWGGREGGKEGLPGSMDGRGIAGGGWRGGERSGSWTELMESVVVNRRGVICGKLKKAMLCGATGGMGTGRNGRVKLTLKTLG